MNDSIGSDDQFHDSIIVPASYQFSGDLPAGDGSDSFGAADATDRSPRTHQLWSDVPWRTIAAAIGLVLAAALALMVLYLASRVVIAVVIAGFFAVVLAQPVAWVQRRFGWRRGAAVASVVATSLLLFAGIITLFLLPVRTQLVAVLTDLPGTVKQAADGRGPVGRIVTQLHLENLVRDHQAELTRTAKSVQDSFPDLIRSMITVIFIAITVLVMTCLMLTQSRALSDAATRLVPLRHREWATSVARDAAKAVSGYMIGNLLISVFAGVAAFVLLLALGVPSPVVLALWVGFADLIPLVGATLGAIVAVLAAFFVSPTAGIIAVVFFVIYQQFENSVLQQVIMSRTVRVNPLVVLLSVLLGVELFGFVGALLAVPIAGALNVLVKELWMHRPRSGAELLVVTDRTRASKKEPRPKPWHRLHRPHWAHIRPPGPTAPTPDD